jgi:hypothetical protein
MARTTVRGNDASSTTSFAAGGVYVAAGSIEAGTISGNAASGENPSIAVGGVLDNQAPITNTTISGNTAAPRNGAAVTGGLAPTGAFTVANSTIASNSGRTDGNSPGSRTGAGATPSAGTRVGLRLSSGRRR